MCRKFVRADHRPVARRWLYCDVLRIRSRCGTPRAGSGLLAVERIGPPRASTVASA